MTRPRAVDDDWGGDILGVATDVGEELEGGLRGGRYAVVWPRREPEMSHLTRDQFLQTNGILHIYSFSRFIYHYKQSLLLKKGHMT